MAWILEEMEQSSPQDSAREVCPSLLPALVALGLCRNPLRALRALLPSRAALALTAAARGTSSSAEKEREEEENEQQGTSRWAVEWIC